MLAPEELPAPVSVLDGAVELDVAPLVELSLAGAEVSAPYCEADGPAPDVVFTPTPAFAGLGEFGLMDPLEPLAP